MPKEPRARRAIPSVIVTVLVALALIAIFWRDFRRSEAAPVNRPIIAPQGNYVTSNSCRACHPGNYASWHASFHRTMTQVATPATLIDQVDGKEMTFAGRRVPIIGRDGKIFVSDRSLGENEYGPPRQIVLLTGSHTLQILWNETGRGERSSSFHSPTIIAEKMWAPIVQTFSCRRKRGKRTRSARGMAPAWIATLPRACRILSKAIGGTRMWPSLASLAKACHSEGREHITANRNPFRRWKLHLTTRYRFPRSQMPNE
jgi:hypothetical protein